MGAYDCDCINNLEYDRRERKAQLSKEGTTSDQHVATDTNVGNNSEIPNSWDCISRQQAIDALDTAIEHYDGIAEECRKKANIERNDYMDMRDDAYEARQLAQWLNELKYLREKIEQLTIQPEERTVKRTETHGVCLDAISRQAAIDIERNATVDTNPSHFEAHQKFTQFMDDAEVSSFGRWQWANGFNTALTAVGIDLKKLPPVQPEPQWILCSEKMPEEYGNYLISIHGESEPDIGTINPNDKRGWSLCDANGFHWASDKKLIVTAWMPLPEPYRKGESNEKSKSD